jgi:hypothetical protein
MRNPITLFGLLLVTVFILGCGQSSSTQIPPDEAESPESSAMPADSPPPSQPPPLEPADEPPAPGASTGADTQPSELDEASDAFDADEPPTSRRVAQVGDGKKGQGYGGGPISEPARQYFRIRERIVFAVQIPEAIKLYKAMNGKAPKTHDEFIEKIINENSIRLPQLRDGETYVYDPDEEELMIERSGG